MRLQQSNVNGLPKFDRSTTSLRAEDVRTLESHPIHRHFVRSPRGVCLGAPCLPCELLHDLGIVIASCPFYSCSHSPANMNIFLF